MGPALRSSTSQAGTMNEQIITLEAPAKLTLSLRITGVRLDGFHLIDAEMVALDLADRIQITSGGHGLEIVGPFAAEINDDENNLVNRALRLCNRNAHVRIDKQIPSGGGMGGGSADAAAILRWALFADLALASQLGADIPFCMVGGRARVQGIGEIISPLPFIAHDITLIIPPFGISTPAVYRAWDTIAKPKTHRSNDLEPAALMVEPRLVAWRDQIASLAGIVPKLAGSGATWWLFGAHTDLVEALPEATVLVTKTRSLAGSDIA